MTQTAVSAGRLGTFRGVFTPSLLTILGIILFLRLGFVVGTAGLLGALAIIGIATLLSTLTSISLAAIATNIDVKGGGDYYLISRTLGMEFGGALGIVLFLAQSVSVAFYAIGFGEAVAAVAGWDGPGMAQLVAAVAAMGLFGLTWAGADVASRFQTGVFVLLGLALVSFYVGAIDTASVGQLEDNLQIPGSPLGFWAVFAIFFPAVTGFTQGVSMSGDLRDPGRSLPLGTFAAVGVSTLVYVSAAVLLGAGLPSDTLVGKTSAMNDVASVGWLIDLGVIAATLSSALASHLGAPRILQSLASDRIFGVLAPFARGDGEANNPRRAALLTFLIALGTIALGDLNTIAPVVSMFFLVSYGLLNYATFYEARAKSPSFRPRFRAFDLRLSLVGALGCLGAMLAISPVAGIVAAAIMFAIHGYLSRQPASRRWVDANNAHYFQRATESLRSLGVEAQHPRHWRPQVLTFAGDPKRRVRLLTFASWLEGGSGLAAAFSIVTGSGVRARQRCAEEQQALEDQIADLGLDVHARAVVAPDGIPSIPLIVQSFGVGRLRANTVLFGWQETPGVQRRADYVEALRNVTRLGVNVVTVSTDEARWTTVEATPRRERRIDVWWDDDDASRLALLAAYLFTRTEDWARARIRVIGNAASHAEEAERHRLAGLLDRFRIRADVAVADSHDHATMRRVLEGATMAFLPVRLGRTQVRDAGGEIIDGLLADLPLTAGFVAATPIDLEAGPDTGRPASIVAAEAAVERARTRLEDAEGRVVELREELHRMIAEGTPGGVPQVRAVEQDYAAAKRRKAKAQALFDDARLELDEVMNHR